MPTNSNVESPPLYADKAREHGEPDLLGHEALMRGVLQRLLSKDQELPIAVLISGRWGTGKSSALHHAKSQLSSPDQANHRNPSVVFFQPWRYSSGSDVQGALLAEVIKDSIDRDGATVEKVVIAIKQFTRFLGRGFLSVMASIKLSTPDAGGTVPKVELTGDNLVQKLSKAYEDEVQPFKQYQNQFYTVFTEWIDAVYSNDKPLVILIDDLDRCDPTVALDVLDSLKLYFASGKFILVAALDKAPIRMALERRYLDQFPAGTEEDARERAYAYMHKLFQCEIKVQPSEEQLGSFFEYHFTKHSQAWKSLSQRDLQIVQDHLMERVDLTPRSVLVLLNNLSFLLNNRSGNINLTESLRDHLISELVEDSATMRGLPNPTLTQSGRRFLDDWANLIETSYHQTNFSYYLQDNDLDSVWNSGTFIEIEAKAEYTPYLKLLRERKIAYLVSMGKAIHQSTSDKQEDPSLERLTAAIQRVHGRPKVDIDRNFLYKLDTLLLTPESYYEGISKDFPSLGSVVCVTVLGLTSKELSELEKVLSSRKLDSVTFVNCDFDEGFLTLFSADSWPKTIILANMKNGVSFNSMAVPTGLMQVSLYSTRISDSFFRSLASVSSLRSVVINDCELSEDAVRTLAHMEQVRLLDLSRCPMPFSAISQLFVAKHLEVLQVAGTVLADFEEWETYLPTTIIKRE